jgi:urease accessory protein
MPPASDWLLWQLADSAFPTGGFAHSSGLEAAYQLGEHRGADAVARFVCESLEQAGASALPLVRAAFATPQRFPAFDALADAALSNPVANRASRAQGASLLATAAATFESLEIKSLRASTRAGAAPLHLAPVAGFVARALDVDADAAARLHLFLVLRSVLSAAVRLGALGPLEAQSLQARLAPVAEDVLARTRALGPDDLAQTSPLLDLLQGQHDRLYSRLFSS